MVNYFFYESKHNFYYSSTGKNTCNQLCVQLNGALTQIFMHNNQITWLILIV